MDTEFSGRPPGLIDGGSHAGSGIPFGIYGLAHTPADAMQSGAVYALDSDISALRLPVVSSCIAEALAAGVPCTLILRSKPEVYLHQLNTPAKFDVAGEIARRHLNVLVMQDEFQKKMFQAGPQRMLEELTHFGVPDRSLVVFEHAAELLNLYDPKLAMLQIEAISAWCAQHRSVALLVFSAIHGRDVIPPEALLDGMAGLARLEQAESGLRVRFPYWQSGGALTTGLSAQLSLDGEGRFIASAHGDEAQVAHAAEPRSIVDAFRSLRGHAQEHAATPPADDDAPEPARPAAAAVPLHRVPARAADVRDIEPRNALPPTAVPRVGAPLVRARRSVAQDASVPKQSAT